MWVFKALPSDRTLHTSSAGFLYSPRGFLPLPAPLFNASISTTLRAITAAPNLAFNDQVSSVGNSPSVLVTVGTGQYLAPANQSYLNVQSYYTVWDHGSAVHDLNRGDLVVRTLSQLSNKISVSGDSINWVTNDGWDF